MDKNEKKFAQVNIYTALLERLEVCPEIPLSSRDSIQGRVNYAVEEFLKNAEKE